MSKLDFENAKLYLIDLLRAYGHRLIIVKIKQNGEEVEVMARTFVKHQLTTAGIEFPYNELNKNCTKIINPDLDNDELSILFHRAVFYLETAYLEEFCKGEPETEAYVNSVYSWIEQKQEWLNCTFSYYAGEDIEPFLEEKPKPRLNKGDLSVDLDVSEDNVKALKKMGFKQISSVKAMMQVFWAFASHRKPIENAMKDAIFSITVDEDAADYLASYRHFYNSFIQAKIERDAWPIEEEKVKKHQAELKALNKRHQSELEDRNNKHKKEIKELKRKYHEELHNKLLQYKETNKKCKVVIRKFRQELLNPRGKVHQIYDLTKEEDINDFISWFRIIHRKVKNQTIKNIVKMTFSEDEEKAELFIKMVEEYNSSLLVDEDIDEDTNTNKAIDSVLSDGL
jgi:hypothetical protein